MVSWKSESSRESSEETCPGSVVTAQSTPYATPRGLATKIPEHFPSRARAFAINALDGSPAPPHQIGEESQGSADENASDQSISAHCCPPRVLPNDVARALPTRTWHPGCLALHLSPPP